MVNGNTLSGRHAWPGKLTGVSDSFLGIGLDGGGFVALGVDKPIVEDFDAGIVRG